MQSIVFTFTNLFRNTFAGLEDAVVDTINDGHLTHPCPWGDYVLEVEKSIIQSPNKKGDRWYQKQ